jgi:hypothetical protein
MPRGASKSDLPVHNYPKAEDCLLCELGQDFEREKALEEQVDQTIFIFFKFDVFKRRG